MVPFMINSGMRDTGLPRETFVAHSLKFSKAIVAAETGQKEAFCKPKPSSPTENK